MRGYIVPLFYISRGRIQKAQMANDELLKRSDVIIDTSGTIEDTRQRTLDAWTKLRERLGSA